MRGALTLAILLVAGFAGCVAAETAPKTVAPTSTAAAAPTVDEETGAVQGSVVDEEQQPIVGAVVALVQTAAETTTDPSGAFTFNDVAPGEYTVAAVRLGYESVARRVQVAAGEIANVNFTLNAVDLAPEPYVLSLPHTAFIQFGNAWGHFVTFAGNATGAHEMMCQSCVWHFHFDAKPGLLLTEARWACSPCYPPIVNADTWFLVNQNESAVTVINTYLTNGEQYSWTEAQTKVIGHAKANKAQWRLNAGGGATGGTGAEGVSYNQRINLWQTFAYHQELPEGYTAFPPE